MSVTLSFSQQEIFDREMYYPNTSVNTVCCGIIFQKNVAYENINECIKNVIRMCSTLRIQLCRSGEEAKQYVVDYEAADFPYLELKDMAEYDSFVEEKLHECIFDYDSKLYRFHVIYISEENKWVIFFNIHHILTDGIGMNHLMDCIVNEVEKVLGNPYFEYTDRDYFCVLEDDEKYKASKKFAKDEAYWKEIIGEYDGNDLKEGIKLDDASGKRTVIDVNPDITPKLKEFCSKLNISMSCFFNTVYAIYKSYVTYSSSVALAMTLHNRSAGDKGILGPLIRTLPFILDVDSESSFEDYIKSVKLAEYEFLKHRKYSYSLIRDNSADKRGLTDLNISFQTFSFQDKNDMGYDTHWYGCAHYTDVIVSISERNNVNSLFFEYDYPYKVYPEEYIRNMHCCIEKIIVQILNDPKIKIKDLEIITDKEKQLILNDFNATEANYPREKTVVEMFEEQVTKTPDNIALVFEDESITYSELNARANKLANKLIEKA